MANDLLAVLNQGTQGTLMERMGIVLTEASVGRVAASMPVAGNTQPYGLLHGGASAALAETVGSYAAMLHAGEGRIAVGIELSCAHHRGAREGSVHAVATAVHEGNTLATYDIKIVDDAGRLVCSARLSCLIRSSAP